MKANKIIFFAFISLAGNLALGDSNKSLVEILLEESKEVSGQPEFVEKIKEARRLLEQDKSIQDVDQYFLYAKSCYIEAMHILKAQSATELEQDHQQAHISGIIEASFNTAVKQLQRAIAFANEKADREAQRLGAKYATKTNYWQHCKTVELQAELLLGWCYLELSKITSGENKSVYLEKANSRFQPFIKRGLYLDPIVLEGFAGSITYLFEKGQHQEALSLLEDELLSPYNLEREQFKRITLLRCLACRELDLVLKLEEYAKLYFDIFGIENNFDLIDRKIAVMRVESLSKLAMKSIFNPYYKTYLARLNDFATGMFTSKTAAMRAIVDSIDTNLTIPSVELHKAKTAALAGDYKEAIYLSSKALDSKLPKDSTINEELQRIKIVSLYKTGAYQDCFECSESFISQLKPDAKNKAAIQAIIESGMMLLQKKDSPISSKLLSILESPTIIETCSEYIAIAKAKTLAKLERWEEAVALIESSAISEAYTVQSLEISAIFYNKLAKLSGDQAQQKELFKKSFNSLLDYLFLLNEGTQRQESNINLSAQIIADCIECDAISSEELNDFLELYFNGNPGFVNFCLLIKDIENSAHQSAITRAHDLIDAQLNTDLKAYAIMQTINFADKDFIRSDGLSDNKSDDIQKIIGINRFLLELDHKYISDEIRDKIKQRLAESLFAVERFAEAADIYQELLENSNNVSNSIIRNIAICLEKINQNNRAMEQWTNLARTIPRYEEGWFEAHYRVLLCLKMLGKIEEGQKNQKYFLLRFGTDMPQQWLTKFENIIWR